MARTINKIEKQPSEVLHISFDFSSVVNTGETITLDSATVSSDEIAIANETIEDLYVNMTVSGGLDGKRYKITVKVDTSDGELIEADGILKVRER